MRRIVLGWCIVLMFCLTQPSFAFDEHHVKSWQGSGNKTTRPFEVPKGWEIQWKFVTHSTNHFAIQLYTAEGDYVDLIENTTNDAEGTAYQPHGGEYYLKISNSGGTWRIEVVDIQED